MRSIENQKPSLTPRSHSGGEDFQSMRYEGFGPGGALVILDCLTDNNTGNPDSHKFVVNPSKLGKLRVGKFECPREDGCLKAREDGCLKAWID
jgi:hypothetical protein